MSRRSYVSDGDSEAADVPEEGIHTTSLFCAAPRNRVATRMNSALTSGGRTRTCSTPLELLRVGVVIDVRPPSLVEVLYCPLQHIDQLLQSAARDYVSSQSFHW